MVIHLSFSFLHEHTHTRKRKYTRFHAFPIIHTASSDRCVWMECGVLSLQRRGDVGSMLNMGLGIQTRPAPEQTIYCFKDFNLQQVFCPSRGNLKNANNK